ncbi:hypothetical protein Ddye_023898 [Dipteronia dyeriana]|uniref:Uncharacterized protein n=1 Tax=Dipteronia dyeriana TaxID=168575 RepID=A0AAD9WTV0_9ROSI|nr:hypothetical protein Ddye_023898 [Dipteronia dyeriana]
MVQNQHRSTVVPQTLSLATSNVDRLFIDNAVLGDGTTLIPDITGMGIEILGAFSTGTASSILPGDQRVVKYNIMSGTSVSCSFAAGAALCRRSLSIT